MSQVQPPRKRAAKHRPETIQLLRTFLINGGTLIVSALLLRLAIMVAVPNTTERGLHLAARATSFLVWPLRHVPPFGARIGGGLTLADPIMLVLIVAVLFVALGVVAGWEHEGQRQNAGTSETGLRP